LSDPLTLADALAFALAHNPRLRELSARVDAARAGETIAFAPFLPEFGTRARYSAFTEPVIPGGAYVPASLAGGANSYSIAEAGTQWTLYDFGRTAGRYGQAVSQTRIAELQRTRGQQVVAFDVARGYFTLLQAQAVARVHHQALQQAEAILDDTRARREGGVADPEAVLRAEVEVSLARERVVAGEQAVRDAEAGLNLALGRPTATPLRLAEPPHPLLVKPHLEECLMIAATQRPEIGAAREAVAEAAYGVEAARGQLKPTVFVRGTVIRADSPGPVEGWLAGAGVHFEQKLYAGGQHRAEMRRQQAQVSAPDSAPRRHDGQRQRLRCGRATGPQPPDAGDSSVDRLVLLSLTAFIARGDGGGASSSSSSNGA
jgi:outer membrane protein TolC